MKKTCTEFVPRLKHTSRKLSRSKKHEGLAPVTFPESLAICMKMKGDTISSLLLAIDEDKSRHQTMRLWLAGKALPRHHKSFRLLSLIEKRYGLRENHFKQQFQIMRTARKSFLGQLSVKDQFTAEWHIPDNFNERLPAEREEIISWIKANVLGSTTEYGKYLARMSRDRYAVLFPTILRIRRHTPAISLPKLPKATGNIEAPPKLAQEMMGLIKFHTASLSPVGYNRYMPWKLQTVVGHVRNFGILFGALSAVPTSPVRGLGIPASQLTFGLLVFPQVWDWLLQWRERRRGFYTVAERSTLYVAIAFSRKKTGWLRQHPILAQRLKPIPGLITATQISVVKADWQAACEETFEFSRARLKEISRLARCHRDPFVPIAPVLQAKSPLHEYRKITNEILKRSVECSSLTDRAKTIRSYLMIRLGAHLGLRQRNLRQLLICPQDTKHRTTKQLQELERGEIRWIEEERLWKVFVPAVAFKNSTSSFFRGHPFELALPDLADLYSVMGLYLAQLRPLILDGARDPGTFFVRAARAPGYDCEFTMHTFYDAWKSAIQRYGIYNPYTGKGAIAGLLPHGPHCIRDVLATHILKMTGSFDLASYAIQDTAETVMRHYGRFLPQEKSAQAALILNEVWDDSKLAGDWARELLDRGPHRIAV